MTSAEGHLLCLSEVLVYVTVELEFAKVSHWEFFFGPDLGSIQRVEFEVVSLVLGDGLDTKFPLGVLSSLNRGPEIFAMEVRILAGQFQSLVPYKAVHTEMRREVEFDKMALAFVVDQSVCVHTEALHHLRGDNKLAWLLFL